jgi:hypothetical protein
MLIEDMRRQWCELDRRIAELDQELAEWVRNETARRLMTISGNRCNECHRADRGNRSSRQLDVNPQQN